MEEAKTFFCYRTLYFP